MLKSTALVLLLVCTNAAFAIRPAKDYTGTPASSGISYDSLNITTSDNFRLTGWYCKTQSDISNTVIVLAGGDAGNMSYDLPLAKFLTQNFNVPVLLFDYRGFGSSQAFRFDTNAIGHPEYLTDLDAAVSYAAKAFPSKKIILFGRSLGGSLALVEGSRRNGICGVIAESPYASQALLAKHLKDKSLNPMGVLIAPIASNDLEPMENIANFKAKNLLVMHGINERYIMTGELEALVQAAPVANKKYLAFEDCDHLEIPFKDPQHFGEAIDQFLAGCK